MDLRETYNRIAEDWHRDHWIDDWWVEGTRAFIARLKPGQIVLDAGCGTGMKSAFLADAGLEVVGIDFSEGMIEIAKREYPYIPFRVHDMRYPAFLECTFDAIFAQASLLHIPKAEVPAVLAEWRRILPHNGLLYVAVKGMWEGRAEEEIRREDDYGYAYERFFSYFEPEELNVLLVAAGFAPEMIFVQSVFPNRTGWIQIIAACV